MNVEIEINNTSNASGRFVGWTPVPCRARITDPTGAATPTSVVTLSSQSAATAGAVVFRKGSTGAFSNQLRLTLPASGVSVPFFVAGRFGRPSSSAGDVTVRGTFQGSAVGSVRLMVRVRKSAQALTPGERDRFIAALAQLNNQGLGRFADFRDMHTQVALGQAHGAPGFLPWHRAYLLDLERELQAIDPSVSLPYWRFDRPAPNIFKREFLGASDSNGSVSFSSSNPLQFWRTDGQQGINRRPFFSVNSFPAGLLNEAQTLALGTQYSQFENMEGNPHNPAHTSFGGLISDAGTAPRDPLFFLLHCNVDRLWAKWQRQFNRFNPASPQSFNNTSPFIGHRLDDTMWPWNGVTGGNRPNTAPGGTLAPALGVSSPGLRPRVRDMLDYQGTVGPDNRQGFDYDDVRFV
jgi:tyrosinase